MATWDDILTARDKQVFSLSGFGKKAGLGERPALLIIDVNYNFTGDKPEPILESVKRFRTSCGEEGWDAVYRIRDMLAEARKKHLTTFYTTAAENRSNSTVMVGGWAAKSNRTTEDMTEQWEKANQIVEEIAPQPGDIIVRKQKPSAFFGTPLMSMLTEVHADTVLVCGTTTSGCPPVSVWPSGPPAMPAGCRRRSAPGARRGRPPARRCPPGAPTGRRWRRRRGSRGW